MLSSSRMLPDHEYPIPQREPLIWIIRDRRTSTVKDKAPRPGPGLRSSLAVAGAGVCSPARERYLIRQPIAPGQQTGV